MAKLLSCTFSSAWYYSHTSKGMVSRYARPIPRAYCSVKVHR
jgi:hypothetical protein